jgi:hypothetical protein
MRRTRVSGRSAPRPTRCSRSNGGHARRFAPSRTEALVDVGRDLRESLRAISNQGTEAKPIPNESLFNHVFAYYTTQANAFETKATAIEQAYQDPQSRLFPFRDLDQPVQSPAIPPIPHCRAPAGTPPALPAGAEGASNDLAPNVVWAAERLQLGKVTLCATSDLQSGYEIEEIQALFDGRPVRRTRTAQLYRCRINPKGYEICEKVGDPVVTTIDDNAYIEQIRGRAQQALLALRPALYGQIAAKLTPESPHVDQELLIAARRITAAKALIQQFVVLGFPRALEHDEWLHALLEGEQGLLDERDDRGDSTDRMLSTLYAQAAQPAVGTTSENPRGQLKKRLDATKAVVDGYLALIGQRRWAEYHAYLDDALARVELARPAAAVAPDRQRPIIVLKTPPQKIGTVSARGVKVVIRSNEAGSVQSAVWVTRATAKKLGLGSSAIAAGKATAGLRAGEPMTVIVPLSARVKAKLRQQARLTLELRIRAKDAAGNTTVASRTVIVRR